MIIKSLITGLLLITFIGCDQNHESYSETNATVYAENGYVSEFGQGYNPYNATLTYNRCVKPITVNSRGTNELRFKDSRDDTLESLLEKISGVATASIPIYPGVDAGATLEFAIDQSKSEFVKTFVFHTNVSQSMDMQLYEYSPHLLSLLEKIKTQKLSRSQALGLIYSQCGYEFVKQIKQGASFTGVIKVDFASEKNFQKYKASLNLSLLNGIGTIEAGAEIQHDFYSEAISVTVSAFQIGGDPAQLTKLFDSGFPRCQYDYENARWAEECNKTFKKLVAYRNGDLNHLPDDVTSFPDQVKEDGGLVPMAYETEAYDDEYFGLSTLNRWFDGSAEGRIRSDGWSRQVSLLSTVNREHARTLDSESRPNIQETRVALGGLYQQLQFYQQIHRQFVYLLEYPSDINQHYLYYKSIRQELRHVSAGIKVMKDNIVTCWKDLRICLPEDISMLMSKVKSEHGINLELLKYNHWAVGVSQWCRLLGPLEDNKPLALQHFPRNLLTNDDGLAVITLYELTNIDPYRIHNQQEVDDVQLNQTCEKLERALIRHYRGHIAFDGQNETFKFSSARIFDQMSSIESLTLRDQALKSFPKFYDLPNLRFLDLANNPFIFRSASYRHLRELPESLQCIDLSALNHEASGAASNNIIKNINTPQVIMHGHHIGYLPESESIVELYIDSLSPVITEESWYDFVAKRQKPLNVTVKIPPNLLNIQPGKFGPVTLKFEPNSTHITCQSI